MLLNSKKFKHLGISSLIDRFSIRPEILRFLIKTWPSYYFSVDYTVKELPESEQPRGKLQDHGVNYLTEVDLLSIIIRTGTRGKNVKELSSEILGKYSLNEIADRSMVI